MGVAGATPALVDARRRDSCGGPSGDVRDFEAIAI
jgi:hypothetical protein